MRADALVAAADHLIQGGTARVVAVFDLADLAALPFTPGETVILGKLLQLPIAAAIDAGVSGIGDVEIFQGEPSQS